MITVYSYTAALSWNRNWLSRLMIVYGISAVSATGRRHRSLQVMRCWVQALEPKSHKVRAARVTLQQVYRRNHQREGHHNPKGRGDNARGGGDGV